MSGSTFHDVIDLDDEDCSDPAAPKRAIGLSPLLFPKLHSILNKKKLKQEQKNIEQIIPSIIRTDNNVNEVCGVVPIYIPQRNVYESQLNSSGIQGNTLFEMVQREMLLVEECFEPLVPVQPPKSQTIHNETTQSHNGTSIKQNANEMMIIQPREQVVIGQTSTEGPEVVNLLNQTIRQEKTIQISCDSQCPVISIPSAAPQNAENPVQANKQMEIYPQVQQKQMNEVLVPKIIQKQFQNEVITVIKDLNIPQITKILMNLLPDMSNAIESMNDMEILDIYKNVQAELPEGQLQKFIKQLSPKLCLNIDQIQNKEANNPQIVRQIEQSLPPVEETCEINPSWSELEVMNYLKGLPFEELRMSMKKYFQYENDYFNQMNYGDLLDVLNQAFAQIQNQAEQNPEIPLQRNRSHQSHQQQVAEAQFNQFSHYNQELKSPQVEQISIIQKQKTKMLQMKRYLLENIQNITQQLLETIKEDFIKMLYDDVVNGRLTKVQITQRIESYSDQILDKSIQKFPHLQKQIGKISKSQMDDLMSQFISKNRKNNQNDAIQISDQIRQQPSQAQQLNISSEHQQNRQQPHQQEEITIPAKYKRSYEAMINQNVHNNQNTKPNSKRLRIKDLREKLIQRLPDLKSNIMALDDSEIQRVYNDSIQKNKQSYTVKRNKDPQSKPVILMKDKKPQIINKPQCSENRTQRQFQNDKIYQINNIQKKKKSKTIVLVHTEEQSDEEMGQSSKYKKTDQGIEKKSSCDCWEKATVAQLLKKLTELLQKKN